MERHEQPGTSSKPKKQKKDVEYPVLEEKESKFADAQAELTTEKDAITAAEPVIIPTVILLAVISAFALPSISKTFLTCIFRPH